MRDRISSCPVQLSGGGASAPARLPILANSQKSQLAYQLLFTVLRWTSIPVTNMHMYIITKYVG